MIDQHIKVLNEKIQGLEKRLFITNEKLSAEKIISLSDELRGAALAANFLVELKNARAEVQMKQKQKPVAGSQEMAKIRNTKMSVAVIDSEPGQELTEEGKKAIHKISEQP